MDKHTTVTVVNRTSTPKKGTYNGRPYDIPVGESRFMLKEARFFRHQNPVMGRGTPLEDYDSKSEYLVAIKELGDDCSPIEQSDAPQRWDTNSVSGYNRWDIVQSRSGYAPGPAAPSIAGGTGFSRK